jgi:hypothetical protein
MGINKIPAEKMKIEKISPVLLDMQRLLVTIETSGCPQTTFDKKSPAKTARDIPPPERVKDLALPTLEIAVYDESGNPRASMLIVDHKESPCEITLHLSGMRPGGHYLLRIDLIIENELAQRIEKPFILQAGEGEDENGRDD